jgi:hypothetical protein
MDEEPTAQLRNGKTTMGMSLNSAKKWQAKDEDVIEFE